MQKIKTNKDIKPELIIMFTHFSLIRLITYYFLSMILMSLPVALLVYSNTSNSFLTLANAHTKVLLDITSRVLILTLILRFLTPKQRRVAFSNTASRTEYTYMIYSPWGYSVCILPLQTSCNCIRTSTLSWLTTIF